MPVSEAFLPESAVKVRFTRDCVVEGLFNICCLTGRGTKNIRRFNAGEVLDCMSAELGEKQRPERMYTVLVGNGTLHPNRWFGIPKSSLELVEE